ncbi:MAG: hypothetical protein KJ601_05770 [Nanoarchaeota archaeon]|nr:hypothetical protein [Nanoarchaeota archaeon]MBU1704961.1 hypothetical protein [Nanoarchaeota archaeon]
MRLTQRLQLVRSPNERHSLAAAERRHLPVRAPTEEEVQFYHQRLDALANLMYDAPFCWYLEGGHVLPLRLGEFARQHADIDMGIYKHELIDAVDFFKDKGYGLFYRNYNLVPLEDTPWDLFETTDINQIRERPLKRLYAMKVQKDGTIDEDETMLREIDMHVHVRDGNHVYASKEMFPLPSAWFEDTLPYQYNGSPAIDVGGLKVFYYFKLGGGRPRHVFDRTLIEERGLLTPDEIAEVKAFRI